MSENYIVSKAEKSDICDIYNLLLEYSKKEIVLKRSKEDILKYLFNFYVIKKNDNIIGCGALRDFSDNLYEIRSLVISNNFQGKGVGKLLVEYIVNDLKNRTTKCNIFALTYQVNFFLRLGFKVTDKNQFPDKIWADCKDCKKRNCCDETAMYISINE